MLSSANSFLIPISNPFFPSLTAAASLNFPTFLLAAAASHLFPSFVSQLQLADFSPSFLLAAAACFFFPGVFLLPVISHCFPVFSVSATASKLFSKSFSFWKQCVFVFSRSNIFVHFDISASFCFMP